MIFLKPAPAIDIARTSLHRPTRWRVDRRRLERHCGGAPWPIHSVCKTIIQAELELVDVLRNRGGGSGAERISRDIRRRDILASEAQIIVFKFHRPSRRQRVFDASTHGPAWRDKAARTGEHAVRVVVDEHIDRTTGPGRATLDVEQGTVDRISNAAGYGCVQIRTNPAIAAGGISRNRKARIGAVGADAAYIRLDAKHH